MAIILGFFFAVSLVQLGELAHVLLDKPILGIIWLGMHTGIHSSMAAEFIIVFHELSPGFLIETALGEGHNQETFDDAEDVLERPAGWVPVLLQGVHTDLT